MIRVHWAEIYVGLMVFCAMGIGIGWLIWGAGR